MDEIDRICAYEYLNREAIDNHGFRNSQGIHRPSGKIVIRLQGVIPRFFSGPINVLTILQIGVPFMHDGGCIRALQELDIDLR